jgi:D-tyrosyl-tRNA(Tyr) deacylase
MKVVIQRVSEASVEIENRIVGSISRGMMILLGISKADNEQDADYLVNKIISLRIFEDDDGKMNLSLGEVNGQLLVVSQFTLYANTRKGRRPSFIDAALPEQAIPLYEYFIKQLKEQGISVEEGRFGAMMVVRIANEGPVTIIIDSAERHLPRN